MKSLKHFQSPMPDKAILPIEVRLSNFCRGYNNMALGLLLLGDENKSLGLAFSRGSKRSFGPALANCLRTVEENRDISGLEKSPAISRNRP